MFSSILTSASKADSFVCISILSSSFAHLTSGLLTFCSPSSFFIADLQLPDEELEEGSGMVGGDGVEGVVVVVVVAVVAR